MAEQEKLLRDQLKQMRSIIIIFNHSHLDEEDDDTYDEDEEDVEEEDE